MSVAFAAKEFAVRLEIGLSSTPLLLLLHTSTWLEKQVVELKGSCSFPVVFLFHTRVVNFRAALIQMQVKKLVM